MVKVRYEVYTQYVGMFDDEGECEWEETYEDEYPTQEEAERKADKHPYGCVGQLVEIYIDDKYYDEYEVEEEYTDDDDELQTNVTYQVVFSQGNYEKVDYETDNYEQAQEVMRELHASAKALGERNFCYCIKEVKR